MTTSDIRSRQGEGSPAHRMTWTVNGVRLERVNLDTWRHPDGTFYIWDPDARTWVSARPDRTGTLRQLVR